MIGLPALVLFALILLSFIFLKFQIAFAFAYLSIIWLGISGTSLTIMFSRSFGGLNSFVLLAIPFFIFAGELMNKSGITDRLVNIANFTVGRMRGGLAQANVVGSLLFAGISGSAVGDVVALGSIFIPAMEAEGYDPSYAAAVTAASSIIGPIIPPSILLVVYGGVTGASVGTLFAAAIIPGIVLGLSLMVVVGIQSRRNDLPVSTQSFRESTSSLPSLLTSGVTSATMPAIILIGILGGIFTPTEAAAVACGYALLLGLVGYRSLSGADAWESVSETIERSVQLLIIIALATPISWLLANADVPQLIADILQEVASGPQVFLLLIGLISLFIGTWLEISVAAILFGPIFLEAAKVSGVNSIQFAMVFLISLQVGAVTPPMGICLFAASSVSNLPVEKIARKVAPFYIADIFTILIVSMLPKISLFIPRTTGLL